LNIIYYTFFGVFVEYYVRHVLRSLNMLFFNDCAGEINLPLRLSECSLIYILRNK